MSKRHIPESHTAHPNVTPLIDIIMCLIIFFMLVAKIGVTTGAEEVDIPASFLGNKIDDMSNTFTINIKPVNEAVQNNQSDIIVSALVDGIQQPILLDNRETGQNQLANILARLMAGKTPEERKNEKVIIRADAGLKWRFITPVLGYCNDAGIEQIAYNTKEASGTAAPAQ